MRKPVDSKRQYLTNDQINLIVETYLDTSGAQSDTDHPMHGRTRTVENIELGHQQITFNYSVPADFEFTSPGLAGWLVALSSAAPSEFRSTSILMSTCAGRSCRTHRTPGSTRPK